jgi:hypothetical protein
MKIQSFIAGLLLSIALVPSASAQEIDVVNTKCLEQVYGRMAHEERFYRSVLFGQKKSEDLPEGSVRYDTEYDTWMKTGDKQWRSINPGNQKITWNDSNMDEQSDIKPRIGLFEVKKTPTSDLIPPMLQSMRALQCRLRAVCLGANQSAVAAADKTTVKVQPDGCLEFELPVFTSCKNNLITTIGPGACASAVNAIIERESRLLQMTVAYDSAYRTLAQFAGIFEGFLTDFRFPLLEPLWQMIRTLGTLDNLPCFSAQCDE